MVEMIFCACGCGISIPKFDNQKRERHYIKGHDKSKGRRISRMGYVSIRDPSNPMSDKQGYVKEHRLIMSKKLGRLLTDDEVVHHINGIKNDNRPENLELLENNSNHIKIHFNGYSDTELKILNDNYKLNTEELLKLLPKRNRNSISSKCSRLGLKKDNLTSMRDLIAIYLYYPTHSKSELKKLLPHINYNTIRSVAGKLGAFKS